MKRSQNFDSDDDPDMKRVKRWLRDVNLHQHPSQERLIESLKLVYSKNFPAEGPTMPSSDQEVKSINADQINDPPKVKFTKVRIKVRPGMTLLWPKPQEPSTAAPLSSSSQQVKAANDERRREQHFFLPLSHSQPTNTRTVTRTSARRICRVNIKRSSLKYWSSLRLIYWSLMMLLSHSFGLFILFVVFWWCLLINC